MKLTFTTLDGKKIPFDFTVSGYSYRRKKAAAREMAVNLQDVLSECALSYTQLAVIGDIMENIGSKFGLLTEFRANGIC